MNSQREIPSCYKHFSSVQLRLLLGASLLVTATLVIGCEHRQQGKDNGPQVSSFRDTLRNFISQRNDDSAKNPQVAKRAPAKSQRREERVKPHKPKVIVYVVDNCALCQETEKFLKSNKIRFRKLNVEKTSAGREFYAKERGGQLPIVTVDEEIIRGFQPERIYQSVTKPPESKTPSDSKIVRF